jgi:hypothetical protein
VQLQRCGNDTSAAGHCADSLKILIAKHGRIHTDYGVQILGTYTRTPQNRRFVLQKLVSDNTSSSPPPYHAYVVRSIPRASRSLAPPRESSTLLLGTRRSTCTCRLRRTPYSIVTHHHGCGVCEPSPLTLLPSLPSPLLSAPDALMRRQATNYRLPVSQSAVLVKNMIIATRILGT